MALGAAPGFAKSSNTTANGTPTTRKFPLATPTSTLPAHVHWHGPPHSLAFPNVGVLVVADRHW
jgi:hypothetical protein